MIHFYIFINMLLFAEGLVAITLLLQMYKRYPYNYFLAYIYHMIFVNLILFFSLTSKYFNLFLSNHYTLHKQMVIIIIHGFLLSLFLCGMAYAFMVTIIELLEKQLSRKLKYWYFFSFFALFLILIIKAKESIGADNILSASKFGDIIDYLAILITLITIAAIFYLLIKSKEIKDSNKRKAVKAFAYLYYFIYISPPIFIILYSLSYVSEIFFSFYIKFFFFLLNLVPIVFMKKFLYKYHGYFMLEVENIAGLNQFFTEYKISRREQEIIQLICKGKKNKDIADELFISLQTVKDHIYHIYQKTGVNSRIQLIRFLLFSPTKN